MKMPTAVVRRRVLPWKPGDPITFPPGEDSLFSTEAGERLPVVAAQANGNSNNSTTSPNTTTATTGVTANGLFHQQLPRPPSSSRKAKDKSSPPPLVVMASSAPPSGQGDRKRFPILGPTRQDTELYFRRRRSARNRIRAQPRPTVTRSMDRVVPADCSPVRLTYSTDLPSNASSTTTTTITPSASAAGLLTTTTITNGINNDALRNFYLIGENITNSSSTTTTKNINYNDRDSEALPRHGSFDTSRGSATASTSATVATTTAGSTTTSTSTGVLPAFEKRGAKSAGSGLKVAASSAGSGSSSLPLVELPSTWNNNNSNNQVEVFSAATNNNGSNSSTACYHLPHFQRGESSPVVARTSMPSFDRSYTYHAGGGEGGGGGSGGEGGGSGSGGGQYSMVRSGGGGSGSGGIRKLEIPIKFLSESGQVRPSELTHRILQKQQQQQQQQQPQGSSSSRQSEKTLQPSKHGFHRRSKSPTFKRLVEAVEKLQAVSADSDSDSYNTDTCNACTGRGSPTTVRLPAVPGIVAGGEGGDGDDVGGGGEGEELAYIHQHDFLSSAPHSTYRSQHYFHQYNHHHHHRGLSVKTNLHGRHHPSYRHAHNQTLSSSNKRHSFHATPAHGSRKSERGAPPSNSCSTSPPALGDPPVYLLGPGDRFYDDDDDEEGGRRLGRGGGGVGARSTTTTHPDLTNGWGAWEVDSSLSVDSCLDPIKMNLPVGMAPADAHTELHLFLPRLADTPSEDGTANGTGAATARTAAVAGSATARSAKPSAQASNSASASSHQHRSRTAALENRATSSILGLAHRGKAVPTIHPHTSHRPPQHPSSGVNAQTQTPTHCHGQTSHSAGSSGGGERHGRSQTAKRFTSPVRGPSKRDRTPCKRRAPPPPSDVYEMYEPFIKGEHLKEKMEDFPTLISLDQD